MNNSVKAIVRITSATLPTVYGVFKIVVYVSAEDGLEHVALVNTENPGVTALVRIHSKCLTGDTFSSFRCDCHEQLVDSLTKIAKSENGILIYLNQEGRGIGLANKIKAYALQEMGLDTVQANEQLGFAADSRNYFVAAQILKDLNIKKINLLTNNPDKVGQLDKEGITVIKIIPIETAPNKINKNYLKTKKNKLGHKLKLI